MRYYLGIICCAAIMLSCNSKNSVSIKGHIASRHNDTVYLESISAEGVAVVDSTLTDKKGVFNFKINLPNNESALYNVRICDDLMTLMVLPGEKIELFSVCNNSMNYSVEGSHGSSLIKELSSILFDGAHKMDSLRNILISGIGGTARDSILNEYATTYIRTKQSHIEFIINNSHSPSAIYALYQRLPGDDVLFNGDGDIIYYRMVADSVAAHHPGSPYLVSLRDAVARYDNQQSLLVAMDAAKSNPVKFPEIDMPNIHGEHVKLSSLSGKTILLYFWSAGSDACRSMNMELKEVYQEYKSKGFEIYQVCVDSSKPLWVTTVQDQKLPWISVSDLKGQSSPALGSYNITDVPTTFLFDRNGEVMGKDIYGDELVAKLKAILK